MLTKFEIKGACVKGLSFHPKRTWILASLHSGVIQLWDYRMCTLLEKFEKAHNGAVRGICFHNQQPIFVSGGDDYKVKVWNYKLRHCLFVLTGHSDFIRSTFFHHEYPWIVSASDDHTIRIWNWQNRSCISVVSGHNYYVMCAQFHPTENYIVSASLDHTIRIWDFSGLCKKQMTPGVAKIEDSIRCASAADLFGQTDVVMKHVLETHDRGVNWACFHPTEPLIVSGGDDRQIKIWKMNEDKISELYTCRGHYNNVSCVLFHPRQNLILSNSEDKSIRVWDMTKHKCLHTFRRSHERFWIMAAHPTMNLFAAGHDGGMIIFKLERERPAYTVVSDMLFYVKDKFVRKLDFTSGKDTQIMQLKSKGNTPVRSIEYNMEENALLVCTRTKYPENSSYDLYMIPKNSEGTEVSPENVIHASGITALWVARDRFAVLEQTCVLSIKNLKNELTKKLDHPSCEEIFYAGTGMLLLREGEDVTIVDLLQERTVAQAKIPKCCFVIWSADMSTVAILTKHTVNLCNKNLYILCSYFENARIKSGAWDESGVFVYSTSCHLKYGITTGDHGTIRTLDAPVYITKVKGNQIFCLDRTCTPHILDIDTTEYKFKLAIMNRKYDEVLQMVRNARLSYGQAVIAYLEKKGYAEVALLFAKDVKTRFDLAIDCGNIEVALESARVLDDKDCWDKLGQLSLMHGNYEIVEMCYQRTKNYDKLSFLYLITGNLDKVRKMVKLAEIRGDYCGQYQGALYLGNVEERIRILKNCGQNTLAYLTAVIHELNEEAETIKQSLDNGCKVPQSDTFLLKPPIPVAPAESNWPLLTVSKGFFDGVLLGNDKTSSILPSTVDPEVGGGDGQVSNTELGLEDKMPEEKDPDKPAAAEEVWDVGDEGLELPSRTTKKVDFVVPEKGVPRNQIWRSGQNWAAYHVISGFFETAFQHLHEQIGAVNFTPFKSLFLTAYGQSQTLVTMFPSCPSVPIWTLTEVSSKRPLYGCVKLSEQVSKLQSCYRSVSLGYYEEAIESLRNILISIPLLIIDTQKSVIDAQQVLQVCSDYILGLQMENTRRELHRKTLAEHIRNCELAAYLTHCNLQPPHQLIALKVAFNMCLRIDNYKTAILFGERLLQLYPQPDIGSKVHDLLRMCRRKPFNQHKLNYDEHRSFSICGINYVPIYRGEPDEKCPFCFTSFLPEHKGKLCTVCLVSEIGKVAKGLPFP